MMGLMMGLLRMLLCERLRGPVRALGAPSLCASLRLGDQQNSPSAHLVYLL